MDGEKQFMTMKGIQQSLKEIVETTRFVDHITFTKDREKREKVIAVIERIGGAVKSLPSQLKSENPHIPWERLVEAGERLAAEENGGMASNIAWNTAKLELPLIMEKVNSLIKREEG